MTWVSTYPSHQVELVLERLLETDNGLSKIPSSALKCLLALMMKLSANKCFEIEMSALQLKEATGIKDKETIRISLNWLIGSGYITRESRAGYASIYKLLRG